MKRLQVLSSQLSDDSIVQLDSEEQRLQRITDEIEQWWKSPRFHNCYRSYTSKQVAMMRGSIETDYFANHMSRKYWELMNQCKKEKSFSLAYGALDPVQAVNASKYLKSIYVSGWQCSSMSSSTNEPGPDFADYPYDTVPKKCDQLIRGLRLQDKKQNFERSQMSEEDRKTRVKIDYLTPLVCDADAGFGGVTSTMKLTKLFIESGAAAIHIEDQRSGTKKCGHMGGKVIVATSEHCQRLIASRLQADIMGCELVILARTDALSAKLLDSNIDPIDHPYILGIYEGHRKPMTYPEAGLLAIDQQIHISKKEQVKQHWLSNCYKGGLYESINLAEKLGFQLKFDWERCRNGDGYYSVLGSVEWCAARAKEYLKYADAIWMETSTPDLRDAQSFSNLLKYESENNKFLTYNLSPSFNWSSFNFSDQQLQDFCQTLANMGYTWQFITLAGFHLNALKSEKVSKELAQKGVLAYVDKVQKKEAVHKVDQLLHQNWSGADYVDQLQMMINAKTDTISQNKDSTENQFGPVTQSKVSH